LGEGVVATPALPTYFKQISLPDSSTVKCFSKKLLEEYLAEPLKSVNKFKGCPNRKKMDG
jgi:hypothetical protein